MRYLQTICTTLLLFLCTGESLAWSEQLIFEKGIVCPDINQVISIQNAFLNGNEKGWMRIAIERGRGRMYFSKGDALLHGACVIKEDERGEVLQKVTIDTQTIYVYQQTVFLPTIKSFPGRAVTLGPYFGLALPKEMPKFRGVAAYDGR